VAPPTFSAIAVHPAGAVQSLNELIAYCKANPAKRPTGTRCRLDPAPDGELFKSLAGTPEIVQVPIGD